MILADCRSSDVNGRVIISHAVDVIPISVAVKTMFHYLNQSVNQDFNSG